MKQDRAVIHIYTGRVQELTEDCVKENKRQSICASGFWHTPCWTQGIKKFSVRKTRRKR